MAAQVDGYSIRLEVCAGIDVAGRGRRPAGNSHRPELHKPPHDSDKEENEPSDRPTAVREAGPLPLKRACARNGSGWQVD